jgi:hypothetical protein
MAFVANYNTFSYREKRYLGEKVIEYDLIIDNAAVGILFQAVGGDKSQLDRFPFLSRRHKTY